VVSGHKRRPVLTPEERKAIEELDQQESEEARPAQGVADVESR